VVGKERNPRVLVNLPVTNVSGCVSRNAKTLGSQHLYFTDVGVGSGPPDLARWYLSFSFPRSACVFRRVHLSLSLRFSRRRGSTAGCQHNSPTDKYRNPHLAECDGLVPVLHAGHKSRCSRDSRLPGNRPPVRHFSAWSGVPLDTGLLDA
jgi:hypothetical protein